MQKFLFIILSLFILQSKQLFIDDDEGVLILNNENFKNALIKYPNIVVKFHAPWCSYCQQMKNDYKKVVKTVQQQKMNIVLAELDCDKFRSVCDDSDVQSLPRIKIYQRGLQLKDISESRTEQQLITSIQEILPLKSMPLESLEQLKFFKSHIVTVFYTGENDQNFINYQLATEQFTNIKFLHTFNQTLKQDDWGLALYKDFHYEEVNVYDGDYSVQSIHDFILQNYKPNMEVYTEELEKYFEQNELNLVINLYGNNEKENEIQLEFFREAARDLRGKAIFAFAQTLGGAGKQLGDYLGFDPNFGTRIFILSYKKKIYRKFKLSQSAKNLETIIDFYNNFENNKLKQYLRSQSIPQNQNTNLIQIVGQNYRQIVEDNSKHVFVYIYSSKYKMCTELLPVFQNLADNHKQNKNILFAKIDASKNDVDDENGNGFPKFLLYLKFQKDQTIQFEGNRHIDDLTNFIQFYIGQHQEETEDQVQQNIQKQIEL